MFTNLKKLATRLGALVVVAAVLFAGCDMLSQKQGSDALLRVTNDLDKRMTVFQGKTVPMSQPKSAPAKSAFTLRAVSRIDPPNNGQHASHLSKTEGSSGDQSVFVGYKVPGATFGGGIDILDASSPTHLGNEDNALRTEDLDVQEVLYDNGGTAPFNLYIAGAVDFGKIDARDYGNTPAVMLRARIDADGNVETSSDGDVQVVEAAMPNRLVKGLAFRPEAGDGTGSASDLQIHKGAAIYAVTDSSVLYSFGPNLGLRNATAITDNDVEFTSVTSQQFTGGENLYTLGSDGNVYEFKESDSNPGQDPDEVQNFSDLTPGGIARLSSYNFDDTARNIGSGNLALMFAALNDGGLAVLKYDGSEIFYRDTGQYYVSVVGAQHNVDNTDDVARVFAAGPNGTIDVFEITSKSAITDGDPDTGLQLLGSFDLGGLEEQGIGSDPLGSGQINQIVVEDDYLYVAAGDEGTLVLEIAENEGDIFQ